MLIPWVLVTIFVVLSLIGFGLGVPTAGAVFGVLVPWSAYSLATAMVAILYAAAGELILLMIAIEANTAQAAA